ncbi:xanthine dehydrogenase family protein molybdopterin-binding subunit [Persicobacter diffluens]|uniref:Isoquinoline 1-oxidoreductase subunit beta n=1 Tax=Persicobacter diffluens TaxID=981 RepID=A0AAN5AKF2_9BACT|nr:isoquinoline 1-oxidoreductase subunit beta [Persicobacter diffluens]
MMRSLKKKVSRRDFLRTSALSGGGLLIGFNLLSACKPEAKMPRNISEINFQDFNAFIKIGEDGYVTIISPNPEIGQGVKTAMPMIIAEELEVSWDKVIIEQGKLNTNDFDRQVAGGSQSIRHGWEGLRATGATARQMLINAAAIRWGVEASTCRAEEGKVINEQGDQYYYGELVADAAKLEIPEKVALKSPKDFKIIGQNATNVDMDAILGGQALYGMDLEREGMVYAAVRHPEAFGQTLLSYDDSATLKIKGVLRTLAFGDKIAVLATNTWAAFQGKDALKVEWKDGPKMESSTDHEKILTALLDSPQADIRREDGQVDQAMKQADFLLERDYHAPFLPHNCMEPMNFFAHVQPDKVELIGPIQTPAGSAKRVAKELNRAPEQISVEMTRMGGGFGRRLYGDFVLDAAIISDKSGLPIKLVYSREDDMTAGIYRPAMKYRIRAAVKAGKVSAYEMKEAGINGNMYGLIPNFFPAAAIQNYRVTSIKHQSDITIGAWRAPYTNFIGFAEQCFFDELAEQMQKDPISLRLELLENAKDHLDDKIQYSPQRMIDTIKLVARKGNWGKAKPGRYQGFSAYYSHNTHVAEIAEIEMVEGLPVVKKVTAAVDCGIVVNPTGAINQVQGGVIDGIGHALYGELQFENGKALSDNFDNYKLIRMREVPEVEVHFVESQEHPTGLGEPGLPPAAAAVANAIFKASGQRIYRQPMLKAFQEAAQS